MTFLQSLKLSGLLSFPPDAEPIELKPLNVLIGPNASGKSNLIECVELLRALPTSFAAAIREGGGVQEWLYKGFVPSRSARLEAVIDGPSNGRPLRYCVKLMGGVTVAEIIEEVLEDANKRDPADSNVSFYFRNRGGNPLINVRMLDIGGEVEHWDAQPARKLRNLSRCYRSVRTPTATRN